MTSDSIERERWPQRRWGFWLAMVFLAQVGLIFGLSDRGPLVVRPSAAGPRLALATHASPELLALYDPTLLALPHPQSFSGPAWMNVTPQEFHPADWSEPTNWLPLPIPALGASLHQVLATNSLEMFQALTMPSPEFNLPEVQPTVAFEQQSKLRIEGELAQRPLKQDLGLKSWPPRTNSASEADLLTNTVVQMVVDAAGQPVSLTLLSRSGLAEADEEALNQARSARFERLAGSAAPGLTNALANLTWGKLIFEWHTGPRPTQ